MGNQRSDRPARCFVAVAVLLIVVAAACSSGDGDGESSGPEDPTSTVPEGPRRGGHLVMGIEAETDGLNPTSSVWSTPGYQMAHAIFDPLVVVGEDGELHPYLLESFSSDADFTEWTFVVREGIRFHDGTPLDAAAVKRNIDGHLASPLTSNPLRGLRSPELVDERTLVLRTDFPWSTLPIYFAGQPGWMAAPSQLDAPDGAPQEPVGTGPFVLERRVLDQETTVVRNEDYWREGLPNLDRVTFRVVPDNQVRNQALRSGEIDTSSTFRDEDIVQFREDEGVTMLEDTVDGEEVFVLLNTKEPPLDDLRVRRAIAHATDTEEYVELLGSGILEPAESPWDPGSPWHTEVDYPQHDPARARELVEEYEADTGEEVRFEMSVPPVPEYQEAMELLQDQWKDAGIEVDLRTVEFTQHILEAATGSFQAKLWRQFGSDDPDGEAVWWLSTNAQPPLATNFARNEDPRIDEALMAARATADVEVRRARYADVARYLTEDLPYIWIYHVTWATILDSDVKGVGDLTAPDGAPRQPMSGGVMPVAALWLDR